MRYYTQLSEDEIRAICLCYPYKELITGFKKCSRDFSALMPGHRPQSISEENGRNLIANNPRSNLTAKMVEVLLSSWMPKIDGFVKEQIADGKETDYAYIVAFSDLGFPSFARIYFHLSGECFGDERISAIESGAAALSAEKERAKEQDVFVTTSKKIEELRRQKDGELKEKEQEIKKKGSEMTPFSERFTLSTSSACSSIDIFLCITPIPPCLAIAIAILCSVTVSIPELIRGICNWIFLVSCVLRSTSFGITSEYAGTNNTSSNVIPFPIILLMSYLSYLVI
mgnify:CR=1 FL=1